MLDSKVRENKTISSHSPTSSHSQLHHFFFLLHNTALMPQMIEPDQHHLKFCMFLRLEKIFLEPFRQRPKPADHAVIYVSTAPCEALRVTGGTVAYTGPMLHGGFYLHPTEAIIACPAGDIPNGPARVVCQEEGGWSAHVNKCQSELPFLLLCTLILQFPLRREWVRE